MFAVSVGLLNLIFPHRVTGRDPLIAAGHSHLRNIFNHVITEYTKRCINTALAFRPLHLPGTFSSPSYFFRLLLFSHPQMLLSRNFSQFTLPFSQTSSSPSNSKSFTHTQSPFSCLHKSSPTPHPSLLSSSSSFLIISNASLTLSSSSTLFIAIQ
ncbi:hypothetical protein K469DRAFT_803535 [Zopfia rhizophila CBS 207.26]|uniref:Uncharacterized protein n=1 Tax=Zopfia rhizophila CBS 207.26 TaxID=1314779 RepID=A0A6A6DGJ8_9PEZI|nr:hypothetical protein K469DRAFT_803535 [Zopfia rhizophila CBS 207.26]